jgi:hypothetical protein
MTLPGQHRRAQVRQLPGPVRVLALCPQEILHDSAGNRGGRPDAGNWATAALDHECLPIALDAVEKVEKRSAASEAVSRFMCDIRYRI